MSWAVGLLGERTFRGKWEGTHSTWVSHFLLQFHTSCPSESPVPSRLHFAIWIPGSAVKRMAQGTECGFVSLVDVR